MNNVETIVRETLVTICGRTTLLTSAPDDLCCLGDPALWVDETLDRLRHEYGGRTNEVLGVVLRTIHADRRMHVLLSISGLINHPEIIAALARAVAGQISEPGTVALLGAALAAFGLSRRRKKA